MRARLVQCSDSFKKRPHSGNSGFTWLWFGRNRYALPFRNELLRVFTDTDEKLSEGAKRVSLIARHGACPVQFNDRPAVRLNDRGNGLRFGLVQLLSALLGERVSFRLALITLNQVGGGTFSELRFDGGKRRSLHAALDFLGGCSGIVPKVSKVIDPYRH
jgi:hypothetical protein